MKAAVRRKYGSPQVLCIEERAKPSPGDSDLLIRVVATTVNRTDCAILLGKPFIMRFFTGLFKPRLEITGTDFAGVVESVGKKVKGFVPGEKVWGFDDTGIPSHAEYLILSQKKAISHIPNNCSFEEAAASAEAAHYAYNFMNKVSVKKGHSVLINGSTSAIGSALLQFMKTVPARVTVVCPGSHFGLMKSLGADRLIDYKTEDFKKDKEQFDFIFDAVGKSTFYECRHLLNKEGIYISSEPGPYAQNLYLPLFTSLFSKKKVIFPLPGRIRESLSYLKKLIEEQHFKPLIDRKFLLNNIQEAFKYVLTGQKLGNVILLIHSNEEIK